LPQAEQVGLPVTRSHIVNSITVEEPFVMISSARLATMRMGRMGRPQRRERFISLF